MLIADIFVTTKSRPELLEGSLLSLIDCTPRHQYRLTLIDDGGVGGYNVGVDSTENILDYLGDVRSWQPDHYIKHRENMGLGPSINQALAHVDALNRYYEGPGAAAPELVAPFVCYCQDDLLYSDGWLERLAKMFMAYEQQHRLGFASGVECVEHPQRATLHDGMVLKDWIRAAQMFGRRSYWMSMFPITRFDPETGRVRAKPNDGIGSGVDWHFIRNHANSVTRTGRTCLVIPGLVKHLGYRKSTWLNRPLPESASDVEAVERELKDIE